MCFAFSFFLAIYVTYDAAVSALQCRGWGGDRGVVRGVLADVVTLPSSRGLQCGAGGGAAAGQTGRRRDPLWDKEDTGRLVNVQVL